MYDINVIIHVMMMLLQCHGSAFQKKLMTECLNEKPPQKLASKVSRTTVLVEPCDRASDECPAPLCPRETCESRLNIQPLISDLTCCDITESFSEGCLMENRCLKVPVLYSCV